MAKFIARRDALFDEYSKPVNMPLHPSTTVQSEPILKFAAELKRTSSYLHELDTICPCVPDAQHLVGEFLKRRFDVEDSMIEWGELRKVSVT